jgi:hypothetical protein
VGVVRGSSTLEWKQLKNFSDQVGAADFNTLPRLQQIQREMCKKRPLWLIAEIYHTRQNVLSLAELAFLPSQSKCGRDKKDHVRALLGLVGRGEGLKIKAEQHNCACSITDIATVAVLRCENRSSHSSKARALMRNFR